MTDCCFPYNSENYVIKTDTPGKPPCFQSKCDTCLFKYCCKNAKVTYTYGTTTWGSHTGDNKL